MAADRMNEDVAHLLEPGSHVVHREGDIVLAYKGQPPKGSMQERILQVERTYRDINGVLHAGTRFRLLELELAFVPDAFVNQAEGPLIVTYDWDMVARHHAQERAGQAARFAAMGFENLGHAARRATGAMAGLDRALRRHEHSSTRMGHTLDDLDRLLKRTGRDDDS